MGEIYIIRNYKNKRVYIGQTSHTATYRFNIHLKCARNDKYKSKLYRGIREVGIENFYVETLRVCDNTELNRYEEYYIDKFNSIKEGYNSIYPGNVKYDNLRNNELDDKIIDLYLNNISSSDIAIQLGTSLGNIFRVIKIYNVYRNKSNKLNTGHSNKSIACIMYSLDFKPQKYFSSKKEALYYLMEIEEYKTSSEAFYSQTKVAFQRGNIVCGHRWQAVKDIYYEDKIFRTKFDKEAYIKGNKAYQLKDSIFWTVDNALDCIKQNNQKRSNKCLDCGKDISTRATRCNECKNKVQIIHGNNSIIKEAKQCVMCKRQVAILTISGLCNSCANVIAKGKSPKPSKEELQTLLNQGLQIKQIAKMYDRTDSTVCYWIKSYELR